MNKIGIYGDTGMVGQEILKILEKHDMVEVAYKQNSTRQEGDLKICDLVFLATKDPESMEFAPSLFEVEGKRIIDMSGAFRLSKTLFESYYGMEHTCPELFKIATYGMPAFNEDKIKDATLVANPGCYVTSVVLALRPLGSNVKGEATIVSTSGNSGARKDVEEESNEWTYNYGTKHKHVPEMTFYSMVDANFTPIVLRSVERGINTNIRVKLNRNEIIFEEHAVKALTDAINDFYKPEDLVQVVQDTPEKKWGTRDVNHTHKCLIKINVDRGYAYINSLIDNLGKGAASQAVENMNIMLGLPRLYGIGETYRTD